MTKDEAREIIEQTLNGMLEEKGLEAVPLDEDTAFLGGPLPIDSLDLAVLITQLQTTTERDPFKDGFVNFRTLGELAALYAQ